MYAYTYTHTHTERTQVLYKKNGLSTLDWGCVGGVGARVTGRG